MNSKLKYFINLIYLIKFIYMETYVYFGKIVIERSKILILNSRGYEN